MPHRPREITRAALDWVAARLVRGLLHLMFRDLRVVGAERLPAGVPVVLVGNHPNGLADPALVLGLLRLRPRFLAKSTMWDNLALRPLLALAGAVPVLRRQDGGTDPARNDGAFARCHAVLARGRAVALFPEGHSHSEPHLLPLRTGAARIVLEAEARHGSLDIRIVPVRLAYDAKTELRSRALIEVGTPIDPASERERHRTDPIGATRALTARIADRLASLAESPPPWNQGAPARWCTSRLGRLMRPLAPVGVVLDFVPHRLSCWIAARATARPEMRVTYTVVAALYLFPLCWALGAAATAAILGPWAGVALAAAGPLGGLAALGRHDGRAGPARRPALSALEMPPALVAGGREA